MSNLEERMNFLQQQIKTLQRRLASPKTDLLENDECYIVRMEVMSKSFVWEIIDGNILLVTIDKELDTYGQDVKEIYRETKYGKLKRRVKLPGKVSNEVHSENWENGVWTVYFKKNIE